MNIDRNLATRSEQGTSVKICIADMNLEGAKSIVKDLESKAKGSLAVEVNASDWDSQVAAFEKAIKEFGRVDYVFPIAGIGERKSIINDPKATKFQKPDLSVIDVDLTGVVYTTALAVQQMRKQEMDEKGFRGKSECYGADTLPPPDDGRM